MKKTFKFILTMLLCFSILGCQSNTKTDSNKKFESGTFEGVAKGNGGDVVVNVTFSKSNIDNIEITKHNETPGIADPALEKIPAQIIQNQSLNVDVISGATYTSNAIIEAVKQCIEKAGGDVSSFLSKTSEKKGPKEDIIKNVEVVVVGAGGAGLAAAVSASENGAKDIIVIEKGSAIGGNTLRAGGGYNAVDESRQSALKMDDSQIVELQNILNTDTSTIEKEYQESFDILKKQIQEYLKTDKSKLFDSIELHTYQTYKGGLREGLDKTKIFGNYTLVNVLTSQSLDALNWLVSHDESTKISDEVGTVLGGLWPRCHGLSTSVGHGFINPLKNALDKTNTEIMLDTRGEHLIMKDGIVSGVTATQSDGTKVTINASKGVILATGGFGANPEMAMEYDNYWGILHKNMKTTNSTLLTGDGINMALEVNANLVGMGYIQLMPSSSPRDGSLGLGLWTSAENQVFVNKEGKRFVSEYESRDVLAKAALNQTDSMFYIICDQESAGNPEMGGQNFWGNSIDDMIKNNDVYTADTIEELAEKIGIDPATLKETIDKYNSYTETQVDTEFNKVKIGSKIDIGPFWATPRTPSIHHTMGGVNINEKAQVLDKDGNVIKGLYAAGEVTGGIHAGNRVGGNALPDIIVFGRIAGKSIME